MKHEKVASSGVLKDLLSFGEIMEDLGVGVIGSDMPRRGFCWHVPLGAWSDFSMLVSRIVRVLRCSGTLVLEARLCASRPASCVGRVVGRLANKMSSVRTPDVWLGISAPSPQSDWRRSG